MEQSRDQFFAKGNVCCRNLLLMYNYLIRIKGLTKEYVDDLFQKELPEGLTLVDVLNTDKWISHVLYDQLVRRIVIANFGRGILVEMGKSLSKIEPPKSINDNIAKSRKILAKRALNPLATYLRLVPMLVKNFNKTKEFIALEFGDRESVQKTGYESCVYMIDFYQAVKPSEDWTSDWWIRGILSETVTNFKLPHAKIVSKINPVSIVWLLENEFQELNLRVELKDGKLFINDKYCGREVVLVTKISELNGEEYFNGEYRDTASKQVGDKVGVLIENVLPEMVGPAKDWQAVEIGEIFVDEEEFKPGTPYYIYNISWKRFTTLNMIINAILGFIASIFSRKTLKELNRGLNMDIHQQQVYLRREVEERSIALRAAQKEASYWSDLAMQRLYDASPNKRIADLMVRNELPIEKREITVLYIDLVNSTPDSTTQDPDVFFADIEKYYDIVESIMVKFGGGHYKRQGDGLLGIWINGLTCDTDEFTKQAYLSALEMRKVLKEIQYSYEIRIGIATGITICGSVGTKRRTFECIGGDVMPVGSRLQSIAEIGEIVIDSNTYEKIQDIVQVDGTRISRASVRLKGVTGDTKIFRVGS